MKQRLHVNGITKGNQAQVMRGCAYGMAQPTLCIPLGIQVPDGLWLRRVEAALHALCPQLPAGQHKATDELAVVEALLGYFYQLQLLAGVLVFEPGKVIRRQAGKNEFVAAFPVPEDVQQSISAINWLIEVFNLEASRSGAARLAGDLAKVIDLLRRDSSNGANVPHFLRAAREMNLPVSRMPAGVLRVGQGCRARWLQSTYTEQTPVIAARLSRNKLWAATVLWQAGIPVPRQLDAASADEAIAAAKTIGYPVVVKPTDLDGGVGVTTRLMTPEAVRAAFEKAHQHSKNILVEKHVEGRDYRVTVFNGQVLWANERVPGGVLGDGVSTIAALIDTVNQDPRRGAGKTTPLRRLVLDEEATMVLEAAGLTATSVPEKGRFVRIRTTANINTGGHPVTALDQMHPDNRLLAVRAAAALRLDIAGVDLLIPDIAVSWKASVAAVCEVNGQPGLGSITTAHLYGEILKRLVPDGGRIPTVLVVGSPGGVGGELTRLLGRYLHRAGLRPGCTDEQGVTIGDDVVAPHLRGPHAGGQLLMADRDVSAVVIHLHEISVLQTGLSFDQYDALVLVDPLRDAAQAAAAPAGSLLRELLRMLLPHCRGPVYALPDVSAADLGALQSHPGLQRLDPAAGLPSLTAHIGDALLQQDASRCAAWQATG